MDQMVQVLTEWIWMSRKQTQGKRQRFADIRLQDAVVLAVIVLLVTSIGLVSTLWHQTSLRAARDSARMIQSEIASRIEEHIQQFVMTPQKINEANAATLAMFGPRQFAPEDLQSLLLNQIQIFESISSIYLGSPAGGLLDAGREGTGGSLYVIETEEFRSGTFNKYSIDEKGHRGELILSVPDFDARTRPWYIAAVKSGGPTWSDVYVLFSGQDMAVAASRPVYGDGGELLLVLSCDIFLSQIDDFMCSLSYGKSGLGFIIDRSGYMVAGSEEQPHVVIGADGSSFQRIQATDVQSPLIRETAHFLQESLDGYAAIPTDFLGEFSTAGGRQFVQVHPISDAYGIDWLSVIVIPEADFLGSIRANAHATLVFLALALAIAIGPGIFVVKRITRPLEELTSAAQAIGSGLQVKVPYSRRIREIRNLSKSFEEMGAKLGQTLGNLQKEIDERKEAQQTLQESEERLRMYIEKAPVAIFVANNKAKHVDVNPAACKMTGYSREELLKIGIRDLIISDTPDEEMLKYKKLSDTGISSGEVKLQTKDGSVLWIQIDAVALSPSRFVSFASDITQRKQTEESLRHQQKMESLGTMASGVAHEINNPLMGMMNYAELIGSRITDPKAQDYAKDILREGERIAHIIRNLLSFSRDDVAARHPADIRDIIKDSLPLVNNAMLRSHVTIKAELDAQVPEITCSRQQIRQVLVNLLMNARDALDVRYPTYDIEKVIRVTVGTLERDGKMWVRSSIEDHGTGMSENSASLAFDPFYTTKSRDKATGLGLTISFGIVQEHGGEIVLDSEEGEGTTVHIDLPADTPDNAS
jgi:PAS domain S-box-containing protein